jgi:hypothetical protein
MPRLKKLYRQLDYHNELGTCDRLTLATNGCYVTSSAMLASSYDLDVDPVKMNDTWTKNGLYVDGCDATDQALPKTFADLWLTRSGNGVDGCKGVDVDGDESAIVEIDGFKAGLGVPTHFLALDHCEGDTVFAGDPLAGQVINVQKRYGDSIAKVAVYRMNRRRNRTLDMTRFYPRTDEERRFPGDVTHVVRIGPDRNALVTFVRPGEEVGANDWQDLGGDLKAVSLAWVGLDLVVTGQGRDNKLYTKRFTGGRWTPEHGVWNETGAQLLA